MAKRIRRTTAGRGKTADAQVRSAIATGRKLALEAVRARDASLRRRRANLRAAAPSVSLEAVVPIELAAPEALVEAAGGAQSLGVLVAEGDSWFDYPGLDVLGALEEQGYDTVSVAHAGHTAEAMAYSDTQLVEFTKKIEGVVRSGRIPKAILLSAGGNDVAGDEFAMLVNHRLAPNAGLNDGVVDGVINDRVRNAYVTILAKVTETCRLRAGRTIPIVLHGYDWPVPDGRGFLGGAFFLPGPWLEPGFRLKGFNLKDSVQFAKMVTMMKDLINRFNNMLDAVVGLPDFSHVRHLDLRQTLSNGADYKKWWANELHPTDRGFTAVAKKYADVLATL
jgi:hypothetical protein